MFIGRLFVLFLILLTIGCSNNIGTTTDADEQPNFSLVPVSKTNINFTNTVTQTNAFNFLNYLDIFNGGGVALGDFNNDDLLDIYFTSNQESNKLYLNQGDFEFKDITASAKVSDTVGWSTGVNVIDINNDGYLDIYVCKSGLYDAESRKNKLYINQGNETFKEEAARWGLDHFGYSIQSYFIDFDKDGDLDLYLVNHRSDFKNTRKIDTKDSISFVDEFSDQLFRNDGNTFANITEEAGLRNKTWGLSAAIGDFNGDNWPDIYVANDFIQPDHVYINNKNGTFSDDVLNVFNHISYNSMGSDYADINNDLLPDLIVLDMLAEDHHRSKKNMATMSTRGFELMVASDYHHAYMSNVLQLNQGNGHFDDIGQLTGISKTDWSWAPLIADFDNDGLKDIFISNGIEKDLANQDFRKNLRQTFEQNPQITIAELELLMPGEEMPNYFFLNKGDLSFENLSEKSGLAIPMNSNGAAYGDLDNDGDLDIVLNNSSQTAAIFENNSKSNYIKIRLKGDTNNIDAIGASIKLKTLSGEQIKENYFARGYQSAMKDALHFGIGAVDSILSIEVIWPDSTISVVSNPKINHTLTLERKNATQQFTEIETQENQLLTSVSLTQLGVGFKHKEEIYNDFQNQVLLPQKLSQLGPDIAVDDLNNDGLEDFMVSGAKGQANTVYIQNKSGKFLKKEISIFEKDKAVETIGIHFIDFDMDGDLDVYCANGSYEFSINSPDLEDKMYRNDGNGNFSAANVLPKVGSSTKKVVSFDYDNDGDLDVFIGGRFKAKRYPMPPKSYILENSKGVFKEVTHIVAPKFENVGNITDMAFSDVDGDGDKDLVVVGEWMDILIFENNHGKFSLLPIKELENSQGWWQSIKVIDIDNDGDDDYLLGNLGNNNKFQPSPEKPLHVYANHLDDNETFDMVLSKKYKGKLVPIRGKECSSEQNPFLSKKFESYEAFANSSLEDIYGNNILEESYHAEVKSFNSSLLVNLGNGNFELKSLPNKAQKGPTLGFEIIDINEDGYLDVIGAGAIHEAEVETIRYDGNTGYILLNDKKGNLTPLHNTHFYSNDNTKTLKKINIKGELYVLLGNNDTTLKLFKM